MIRRAMSIVILLVIVAWLATHSLSQDWHEIVALGLWVQHAGGAIAHRVVGRGK